MFQQQMAEYRESGEVEKPILSEEAAKERSLSEVSVEVIDIKDEDGDKALDVGIPAAVHINNTCIKLKLN